LLENGKKHKTTQKIFKKSNKVKESSKKAAEASRSKRLQMKEERERAAGNQEPVIEFDTFQTLLGVRASTSLLSNSKAAQC
jgi:hypothetical protein